MADYEYLTSTYSITGEIPHRIHVELYTLLRLIGVIDGKTFLDVASGHGLYSRILKQSGASRVVGIDLSESLVQLARHLEQQTPLGIEYHVMDVVGASGLGSFDTVVAAWLTPYARSFDHLSAMARSLRTQVAEGGHLVGVAANPALDLTRGNFARYGMTVHAPDVRVDGSEYVVEFHLDPPFSIAGRFWSKEAIERALSAAGFHDVAWSPAKCSKEGIEKFGAEHWAPILENPNMLFFSARA